MRFVAAIGLAALAAGCAPKLELADGNSYARQAATRLAQGPDEIEAAASPAQAAKPAVRNARSSPFRVQTVSAHDQGIADAQNNLAVPAPRGQPNIAAPAATVALPGTTQRDGEVRDFDEPLVAHPRDRFAREKENPGFAQFHIKTAR